MIVIDLKNSLKVLNLPQAAHYLEISHDSLRKLVKNNEVYRKWFWKHGADNITSPLCLMLLQLELTGHNLQDTLQSQALEHLRKAA